MENAKIASVAAIITICIIVLCGLATATAETLPEDSYTLITVVINCEPIDDSLYIVDCITDDGNVWSFYDDIEEWHKGDIAILTMRRISEVQEEDEVIDAEWFGYTNLFIYYPMA